MNFGLTLLNLGAWFCGEKCRPGMVLKLKNGFQCPLAILGKPGRVFFAADSGSRTAEMTMVWPRSHTCSSLHRHCLPREPGGDNAAYLGPDRASCCGSTLWRATTGAENRRAAKQEARCPAKRLRLPSRTRWNTPQIIFTDLLIFLPTLRLRGGAQSGVEGNQHSKENEINPQKERCEHWTSDRTTIPGLCTLADLGLS